MEINDIATPDAQPNAYVTIMRPNVGDQILVGAAVVVAGTIATAIIGAAASGFVNYVRTRKETKALRKAEKLAETTETPTED